MMKKNTLIAVLGPTASGKSSVALELARRMKGEIISCDSMQVYRELNVGTAKPSKAEREAIPHHLINALSMSERFDTNRFVLAAQKACKSVWRRGNLPILAGGTGLYAKALIYGFKLQPASRVLFQTICREAETAEGLAKLAEELRTADKDQSISADTYANPRRLIRAVEILRLTGSIPAKISQNTEQGVKTSLDARIHQFVLLPPNTVLREKINVRCGDMLNNGWIEEACTLAKDGLFETPTAYQALGYREILEWVKNGSQDRGQLQNLISTKTWQYARRQMTWFRHQHPGACLLTSKHEYTSAGIADGIEASVHFQ